MWLEVGVGMAALFAVVPALRWLVLFLFFAAGIFLEEQLSRRGCCPRLRFPRSPAEIRRDGSRFFTLLRDRPLHEAAPLLPAGSRLADACELDELKFEPAKNATSCGLRLRYHASAQQEEEAQPGAATLTARHADVFVKWQCGRGQPLWLQALRLATAPGVAREVLFYQRLAHRVPQRVARPFYADAAHWCNRVCIVLEHLGNSAVTPDWQGGSEPQLRSVAVNVAAMHARWWGRVATDEGSSWIPAQRGLDFAEFVTGFLKVEPPWFREIWAGLVGHFERQPVTLVHGDCRLGNMLFPEQELKPWSVAQHADGALQKQEQEEEEETEERSVMPTVFSDWEAVNAGPALWDLAYLTVLSQRAEQRRQRQPSLLRAYLAALRRHGAPAEHCERASAERQLRLLMVVLFFVSSVVVKHRLWAGQGNTTADGRAWAIRIAWAVRDATATVDDCAALGKALGVPAAHFERLRARAEAAIAEREAEEAVQGGGGDDDEDDDEDDADGGGG